MGCAEVVYGLAEEDWKEPERCIYLQNAEEGIRKCWEILQGGQMHV